MAVNSRSVIGWSIYDRINKSFFYTLNVELTLGVQQKTRRAIRENVFEYIECYNLLQHDQDA